MTATRQVLCVLLGLAVLLGGCHKHVLFDPLPAATVEAPVVRAFFDRNGDLYPPGQTDRGYLGTPQHISVCEAWREVAHPVWGQGPRTETAFRATQASYRDALVTELLAGTRPSTIVVLIHGFNTPDPVGTLAEARTLLRSNGGLPADTRFLEIAWDGLHGWRLPWGKAQFNLPLVGAGLRRLLNELTSACPTCRLRVLTFSAGGPVAAHALWDASAVETLDEDECRYGPYRRLLEDRAQGRHPAPPRSPDVRVLMTAPATSGRALTGLDHGDVDWLGLAVGRDVAIRRGPIGCRWFGSTCLGASNGDACPPALRLHQDGIGVAIADTRLNTHDWLRYLQHVETAPLLDAWLGSGPPTSDLDVCPDPTRASTDGYRPLRVPCPTIPMPQDWCR